MTLEENQKLKEKLRKLGYYIQLYPDKPEQWATKLYDEVNGDDEIKKNDDNYSGLQLWRYELYKDKDQNTWNI